jgi:hypothetical protein
MAWTDREKHRDRDTGHRVLDEDLPRAKRRGFRLTDDERERIAKSLRLIDQARLTLQEQNNRQNRAIIRDLHAAADRIFEVINGLDEIDAS